MTSPTPPYLPAGKRAAPARKIKPLVWILGGISLLLVCATLAVGFLAVHAVKNAGLAFRFDPAKKTLVMIEGDDKEVKMWTTADGESGLGMAAEPLRVENRRIDRKLPGCGDETNGCAHVEITYVEVFGGPAAARDRINAAIVAFMTNCGNQGSCVPIVIQPSGNHKFTPESFAQGFIDDNARVQKDFPTGYPGPDWGGPLG